MPSYLRLCNQWTLLEYGSKSGAATHHVREDRADETEEDQDDDLGQGQPDADPQEVVVVFLQKKRKVR